MSTRDIFYLDKFNLHQFNKFGREVGHNGWSWCTDEYLTYTTREPSRDIDTDLGRDKNAVYTVHMLSLRSRDSRALLVYPGSYVYALCLRQGKFMFMSGSGSAVQWPDQATDATSANRLPLPHMHVIELGAREKTASSGPEAVGVYGPRLWSHTKVDTDGNIYAEVETDENNRRSVDQRQSTPVENDQAPRIFKKDQFKFVVYASDSKARSLGINLYGLESPSDPGGTGSYPCPAPRPGCDDRRAPNTRVYYKFSKDHDQKTPVDSEESRSIDVLYTAAPGPTPRIQRWPIVKSRAADGPRDLVIVDVAVDAQRCFVLLQPLPWTDSPRIPGRKGIDLYLADCTFRAGRLEYGKTRQVGINEGALRYYDNVRVTFHGDTVVVSDQRNFVQPEQKPEQKPASVQRIPTTWGGLLSPTTNRKPAPAVIQRFCVRLFSGQSAGALEQINALCMLKDKDRIVVDPIHVSPNAQFILFEGPGASAIVGRDYRNDGAGPEWLTHGE